MTQKKLGLTARQMQLLNFIREELQAGKPAPTYAEMMAAVGGKAKSNIHRLVKCLQQRGHIARGPKLVRAIALVEEKPHRELCDLCRQPLPTERPPVIRAVGLAGR